MANKRRFQTAEEFFTAVEEYFNSISAEETATRLVPNGLDEKGKQIYAVEPVLNRNGEELKRIVWYKVPSISGLCLALGISRKTFKDYSERGGTYGEAVSYARSVVLAYLDEARSNPETRNVKGVDLAMSAIERSLEEESKPKQRKMTHKDYEDAFKRAMENGFFALDGEDNAEDEE